jgi:pilus assembly protein Flp/PilA
MIASFFKRLQDDTAAATAIEYGLIISLMVIAMIAALQGVAGTTINMWQTIETKSVAAMATP